MLHIGQADTIYWDAFGYGMLNTISAIRLLRPIALNPDILLLLEVSILRDLLSNSQLKLYRILVTL